MNFRGLTLIPTPRKNVNKIMGKLFKSYWMLTQANMKKTERELKFEPTYDIRRIEEYPKAVEMALNLWFQESILSAQYNKMFKNELIST